MTSCSRRKRAWTPKALPVRCWQARQWHIETRSGSPVQSMVSWPQQQDARRLVIGRLRVV